MSIRWEWYVGEQNLDMLNALYNTNGQIRGMRVSKGTWKPASEKLVLNERGERKGSRVDGHDELAA